MNTPTKPRPEMIPDAPKKALQLRTPNKIVSQSETCPAIPATPVKPRNPRPYTIESCRFESPERTPDVFPYPPVCPGAPKKTTSSNQRK